MLAVEEEKDDDYNFSFSIHAGRDHLFLLSLLDGQQEMEIRFVLAVSLLQAFPNVFFLKTKRRMDSWKKTMDRRPRKRDIRPQGLRHLLSSIPFPSPAASKGKEIEGMRLVGKKEMEGRSRKPYHPPSTAIILFPAAATISFHSSAAGKRAVEGDG